MAEFKYSITASVSPQRVKPGETINLTAKITDVEGDLRNVVMSVPQYGIMEYLRPRGDGETYVMTQTVPWEAPAANYELRVYATSTDNQRGPQERVTLTVT